MTDRSNLSADQMTAREWCNRPPAGWVCSRGRGHEGPCAAVQAHCHFTVNDVRCTRPGGHEGDHVVPLTLVTVPPAIPSPPDIQGLLDRVHDGIGGVGMVSIFAIPGRVTVSWRAGAREHVCGGLTLAEALQAVLDEVEKGVEDA